MLTRNPNTEYQEPFRLELEWPRPKCASGLITCSTKANLADTDFITIGDGLTPAKLYEFDTAGDGVTAGSVQVNVSTDTTAAHVAARLKTAIEANQPALAVTDNADGTLTLVHKFPGSGGNVTITENVTHASFLVSGMSGGQGPNLAASASAKLLTLGRAMRVEKVELIPTASFAAHADNHWTLAVKKGATTMASWSTDSDAEGALTADTPASMVLSATDTSRVGAAGDVLSFALTKAASAADFPPGRVVVSGRYL